MREREGESVRERVREESRVCVSEREGRKVRERQRTREKERRENHHRVHASS